MKEMGTQNVRLRWYWAWEVEQVSLGISATSKPNILYDYSVALMLGIGFLALQWRKA